MQRNLPNVDDLIQICNDTLTTARTLEILLRDLNGSYTQGLENLRGLEQRLQTKIDNFFSDIAPLEAKIASLRADMEQMTQQMNEIREKIGVVENLSNTAQEKLIRLEEINTNIIQIEQRIKDLVDSLDLSQLENRVNEIKEQFKQEVDHKKNEALEIIENGINNLGVGIAELDAKKKLIEQQMEATKNQFTQAVEAKLQTALENMGSKETEAIENIQTAHDRTIKGKAYPTFQTLEESFTSCGCIVYQEVFYNSDKTIAKYGDIFFRGYNNQNICGGAGAGGDFVRVPIPYDIECDLIGGFVDFYHARPKLGQTLRSGESLDNAILSWGKNNKGYLGVGDGYDRIIPAIHHFPARVKKIVCGGISRWAGESHGSTLVLLENGELYGTGANWGYMLGIGNNIQTNSWTLIQSDIEQVYSIRANVFVVKRVGNKKMLGGWGENGNGCIGVGRSGHIGSLVLSDVEVIGEAVFKGYGFYTGSAERATIFVKTDDKFLGAGGNGAGEITTPVGGIKNTWSEVANGGYQARDVTDFFACPTFSCFFSRNGNGEDVDLIVAGYGEYGYGDTSATGAWNGEYPAIHHFKGLDWKIAYQLQVVDGTASSRNSAYMLFFYSNKYRQIWAIGDNYKAGLGVSTGGAEQGGVVRSLTEVVLPARAKTAKFFEVRPQYLNGMGGICVIIDDELWVSGKNEYGIIKFSTRGRLERQV